MERGGSKLEDLLTQSNPWQGQDCGRSACLLCKTKQRTGKQTTQSCSKRSLCYQIWCVECRDLEEKKIDAMENIEDKERMRLKNEIPTYKYIGETSRSAYERAWEHEDNYSKLSEDSYMLKHSLDIHEDKVISKERFGIRVLKYTKTPFERQIRESVYLQQCKTDHLLNSKSEYNRCSIPRLSTKLGEKEVKENREEEEREKKQKS